MIVGCVGIGVGAETRIAIGDAYLLTPDPVNVTATWIPDTAIDQEITRFELAVEAARQQLHEVRRQIPADAPSDIAEFIDTHLLMVEDKAISGGVIQLIRTTQVNAEWALQQHRDALVQVFEQMQDTYLRTRRDDLDHVVKRIQGILQEQQHDAKEVDLAGRIVLAEDLSPADVILLHNQDIAGFVTEYGGPMSHTAILARSLGLPAVIGARGAAACLRNGELLVLDTDHGCVLAGCPSELVDQFEDRREYQHERAVLLRKHSAVPALTRDGTRIELLANIELPSDAQLADSNGADGVGLYRTEFLYMNRQDIPDEEEHLAAYREILQVMGERPVTIRTLDLGADKQAIANPAANTSCNPALGLRAIRLCLKEPALFRPQVRAILRASAFGNVRLMLPMLTSLWEVEQARKLIDQCMGELDAAGHAYNPALPIGGMIEVPAAALCARAFAEALDFLSIGTNDLIQYTLAIDRIDDEVNYLYDPFHPAVLTLIQGVIDACRVAHTPLSMCGEMASDSRFVPLLLGMGLHSLSMQPGALLDVKQQLQKYELPRLRERAARFLEQMHNADPLVLLNDWH